MAVLGERAHQAAELLKDVVYAANDGVITTFAVAAGVWGGGLSALTVLILGFANLFADGFSMAVSNYLGTESEKEFLEAEREDASEAERPLRNSIATFFSFVLAGALPILPFLPVFYSEKSFSYALTLAFATLFLIGSLRSFFTRRNWLLSGLEALILGGLAAGISYGVGFFIRGIV